MLKICEYFIKDVNQFNFVHYLLKIPILGGTIMMLITKINREPANDKRDNKKKLVNKIAAVAVAILLLTALVAGSVAEKKTAQAPEETIVAEMNGQQVLSLQINP